MCWDSNEFDEGGNVSREAHQSISQHREYPSTSSGTELKENTEVLLSPLEGG